ncbi:nicotinate phosphoribosyltransferase [Rhodotorula kratochvilovae]
MAAISPKPECYIQSILDSDLYKFRQYAIRELYPDVNVKYRFTNRGGTRFTRNMYDDVLKAINHLETLSLTPAERAFLERRCPYFPASYLDYLSSFRFRPAEQVRLQFVPREGGADADGTEWGSFELEIEGKWVETILYEVPLMSIISEAYFTHVDTAWDYTGQFENARQKGHRLYEAGCLLSEFGSRRRRTYKAHDIVMRGLIRANEECGNGEKGGGKLVGTSNVHFAHKYDVAPIGTIAHEMVMGIAALEGYEGSNGRTMDAWEKVYPDGSLGVALTDTFTTKPFFDDFVAKPERARRWKGLRQDSGDPFKFIPVAKEAFERVGADPKTKVVVFSDSLDVPRCIELKKAADAAGIGCSFGVGTDLTNDFRRVEKPVVQEVPGEGPVRTEGEKSKALNMVIKLYSIDGQYCVKISDELTKNTGDPEAVALVKRRFGLEDHGAEATPGPTV